ncbi:hypothetical protein S2M10_01300 [Sphingomonas sp. S2M10]|uniref:hypothetical protein n=1 Tax=Sphingomonas sp. S2M10 TaxID=2705010 RepID=UPI001457029C|nr:hypothetical protein [Sphingomonas sp. S2M10]NLS25167.1 hypothetical protein [Sphingomonas sp. S2M10]
MTQPIGISGPRAAALGAIGATDNRPRALAGQAMTVLSNRVAGTLTRELGLAQGAATPLRSVDPYGAESMARELATAVGASPADAGRLARALNDFTSEVASLVAASPTSDVLDRLSGLGYALLDPDGRPGMTDADHAVSAIDGAIFQLREAPVRTDR